MSKFDEADMKRGGAALYYKEQHMLKYILIPLLPLLSFIINILFGRNFIKDKAHWIAVPAVAGSFILAVSAFMDVRAGNVINVNIYNWIVSGNFNVTIGLLIDQLTAIMLIVVTSISTLIFIYSIGYMHGDGGYYRFFSYLSLFVFSMLMLVMAIIFFSFISAGRQSGCVLISLSATGFTKNRLRTPARRRLL
jgi:NADH-quinone oxidoreductase subunit L